MDDWDSATTAVIAHSLLGSVAVVVGAAETLRKAWEELAPSDRAAMLDMIVTQGRHLTASLRDLARGLPPDVEAFLDQLDGNRST